LNVWIVIAEAVYDHGVYGVFCNEEQAVEHANKLIDESDYHHRMRVEPWGIDYAKPADKTLTGWRDGEKALAWREEHKQYRPKVTVVNP